MAVCQAGRYRCLAVLVSSQKSIPIRVVISRLMGAWT